jgi:general secretion pathway protein C
METLLRKYLWAVDLAVVALGAALCGLTASDIVAMRLAPVPLRLRSSQPAPAKVERPPAFDKRPDAIIRRNLFCSDCPSLVDEAPIVATETPTTLPIALLAVMYAPAARTDNLSIAVLKDTDAKLVGAFAVGDRIHGAAITDIRETRIYVDHDGLVEYLDLLGSPSPSTPPTGAAAGRREKDPIAADLERGIKQLGEHRYEIERRTLASVLENVGLLARTARPVPEIKDGRMTGFRLFAVLPHGPVAMIGMRNGDVITAINGLELASPDKVVEAFGKLRSASHLSLQFERNGDKLTNDYVIR